MSNLFKRISCLKRAEQKIGSLFEKSNFYEDNREFEESGIFERSFLHKKVRVAR